MPNHARRWSPVSHLAESPTWGCIDLGLGCAPGTDGIDDHTAAPRPPRKPRTTSREVTEPAPARSGPARPASPPPPAPTPMPIRILGFEPRSRPASPPERGLPWLPSPPTSRAAPAAAGHRAVPSRGSARRRYLDKPYVIIGVPLVASRRLTTGSEYLHSSYPTRCSASLTGNRRRLQPPVEHHGYGLHPEAIALAIGDSLPLAVIGGPETGPGRPRPLSPRSPTPTTFMVVLRHLRLLTCASRAPRHRRRGDEGSSLPRR